MKFCIYCGQPLPDFAAFCPVCGKKQPLIVDEEKEQPVEEQVIVPPVEEVPEEIVETPKAPVEVVETPVEEEKPDEVVETPAPIEEEQPEEIPQEIVEEEIVEEPQEDVADEVSETPEEVVETPIEEEIPEEVTEAPIEEAPDEVIEAPKKEAPVIAPVIEKPTEKVDDNESKNGEEKDTLEEDDKNLSKVEKVVQKLTKNNKFFTFLFNKDPLKFSLIFLGALFALSLLIWILSTVVYFGVFLKILFMLLSLFFALRIGYFLYLEIKYNKMNDMFNLLLKGSVAVVHLFLFILNFAFMFI